MTEQTALEPLQAQQIPDPADGAALLREIRDNTAAQAAAAKRQLFMARVNTLLLAVMTAAVLCFVGVLIPRISATLDNANLVLANLQTVTQELNDADIAGILSNVNALVTQGEASLTQALGDVDEALRVIQELDIATLNEAIDGLYRVVHPLSSLFGK